jgi:hypothetical protein
MIARSENEFKLFNRMDIARREYESLHGVGSGGDGANERRAWKLSNTTVTSRIKRKKESDNEDSIDQTIKTKYLKSLVISLVSLYNILVKSPRHL